MLAALENVSDPKAAAKEKKIGREEHETEKNQDFNKNRIQAS